MRWTCRRRCRCTPMHRAVRAVRRPWRCVPTSCRAAAAPASSAAGPRRSRAPWREKKKIRSGVRDRELLCQLSGNNWIISAAGVPCSALTGMAARGGLCGTSRTFGHAYGHMRAHVLQASVGRAPRHHRQARVEAVKKSTGTMPSAMPMYRHAVGDADAWPRVRAPSRARARAYPYRAACAARRG